MNFWMVQSTEGLTVPRTSGIATPRHCPGSRLAESGEGAPGMGIVRFPRPAKRGENAPGLEIVRFPRPAKRGEG